MNIQLAELRLRVKYESLRELSLVWRELKTAKDRHLEAPAEAMVAS
jgi:hypothetical protein